jgi:hypothetical protein
MAKRWAGITAGMLAGAAGATAKNVVSYLDQAVLGDAATTSPAGSSVSATAQTAADTAGAPSDTTRTDALGPLGGLGIGIGVGAVAGLVRGSNATPPPVVAAVLTGLVAMGAGEGAAVATGSARSDWAAPANLLRDFVPHLAYGAVTGWALHRMVDPRTSVVSRFRR